MFGPAARDVLSSANATPITIGAGATVYTKSFDLKFALYFALHYKAASAGAIDLTIQLQQSFKEPAVEGADEAEWVIPDSMADIHTNLADANWHGKSFSPVAMRWGRFKIVSAAGVANTLEAKLSIQEDLG